VKLGFSRRTTNSHQKVEVLQDADGTKWLVGVDA